MTDQPRSRTGRQLARAAEQHGWTWTATPGHGTTERGTLVPADTGRQRRHVQHLPCLSEAIRLAGPDGRRAWAVLISLDDGATWALDDAWTWTAGNLSTAITISSRALLDRIRSDAQEASAA